MTEIAPRLAPAIGWATGWIEPGSTIRRKMSAALKAVQCAQMVSVLNQLPDTYLREAGLRREDLPEHARRTICGKA